jgi:outer membrane lipoprotein-sorting protein
MKKNIPLFIAMALLISQAALSQAKKTADEILKEVSEKTKSYTSIRIDFTYNMDNAEAKIHESESGSLLVKGDKYRLNIAGQVIISDSKTMWTYIEDANEVQVNTVDENQDVFTPTKLLTSYSEQYKSKLIGEEVKDGKTYQIIELKPNEEKNYSRVELTIDKNLKQFTRIAVQDKSGNTFTYIVNEFKPDAPYKDSDFAFTTGEFPGAEVIDMR